VEAGLSVLNRVHFHYAAHFSAVLGGETGSVDSERVDIFGFNFRSKTGGAVIRERNAVDHKLGLIFRATRMEHGVAFVKPAGLRVDEVLDRTTRQRAGACSDVFGTDLADIASAVGVQKGIFGSNGDGGGSRIQAESNRFLRRDRGANFDDFADRGETGTVNGDLIKAVREVASYKFTGIVGLELVVVLVGRTVKQNSNDGRCTLRIEDLETEFAGIGLR